MLFKLRSTLFVCLQANRCQPESVSITYDDGGLADTFPNQGRGMHQPKTTTMATKSTSTTGELGIRMPKPRTKTLPTYTPFTLILHQQPQKPPYSITIPIHTPITHMLYYAPLSTPLTARTFRLTNFP